MKKAINNKWIREKPKVFEMKSNQMIYETIEYLMKFVAKKMKIS